MKNNSDDNTLSPLKGIRDLLADVRPGDLLLGRGHPVYLERHRAGVITRRVQLIALVFAVLTPLWGIVDWILLPWPDWGLLACGRVASAGVFLWLARPRPGTASIRKALIELGLLLVSAPALYLLSVLLLPAGDGATAFQLAAGLYALLPFITVAGLSVFPLAAAEVAAFSLPVLLLTSVCAAASGVGNGAYYSTTIWLLMLVLGTAMLSSMGQLHYMVTLVRTASHDALTRCFTRRTGIELLELQFRVAARHGGPIAVLFVDVDRFKSVNDRYGHEAGDQVLREVAGSLRGGVRQADSVIRWGGEEFVLVLANTGLDGAEVLIRRLVSTGFGTQPDGAPVTVSIGAAERIADGIPDWPHLIEVADRRMYTAKKCGRHRYALSDGTPQDYLPLGRSTAAPPEDATSA